ncbi:hypothetical protein MMC28_009410 [Mycoblastus sanguinarius]|nr:hypothetical protein [Mycoblastus sanguinarius]
MTPKGQIPTVDISAFTTGNDSSARQATAKSLAQACLNGCVGIIGHGVPAELLKQGFDIAKQLFDLPMSDKMKAPHPKGAIPHRGYSAPGMEKAYSKEDLETNDDAHRDSLRKVTDCKETYEVGSEHNPIQYNIWLPEDVLPGFRDLTTKLYWELHKTSVQFLDALIMSLGMTADEAQYVRSLHSGHGNQLRLAHYPPIPVEKLNREVLARLPAHTDWSTFTLLFQDSAGGLEFADRENEGEFLPAIPDGDKLYLNVGDMLMRLSNGRYPSATHRVTVPQSFDDSSAAGKMTPARYSIPYFVVPDDEAVVFPQPSCTTAGNPARYEKVTMVSYAEQMSKWQYEKT